MQEPYPPLDQTETHIMFDGLGIAYNSAVLEPRPWTQAQSGWAAELLRQAPVGNVLELCAGVGHIGLAAVQASSRSLVMVDFNPVAQRFAQKNAETNGLSSRAEFRLGLMEEVLDDGERYPVIIADPPWVPSGDTSKFPEDPRTAIDGGDDGLDLARTCVELIDHHLAEGGSALLQLGTTAQVQLIDAHAAQLSQDAVRVVESRSFDDGVIVRLAR